MAGTTFTSNRPLATAAETMSSSTSTTNPSPGTGIASHPLSATTTAQSSLSHESNNAATKMKSDTNTASSSTPTTNTSTTATNTKNTPNGNSSATMTTTTRSTTEARKKNLAIRTFSPVNNEIGCFECDRVLKAGDVQKRTRKTKSWKPVHLVLRPQSLSLYADKDGTKLRHQIQLTDITAVARQRDPKRKERHVFALFSPSRNYHIEAPSETEAQSWVEMIRSQARIGEEEDEIMALMSPGVEGPSGVGVDSGFFGRVAAETSASEVDAQPIKVRKSRSRAELHSSSGGTGQRKQSLGMQYLSGAEAASYSDFSDAGGNAASLGPASYEEPGIAQQASAGQRSAEQEERARKVDQIYRPSSTHQTSPSQATDAQKQRPSAPQRSVSGVSVAAQNTPERILYNGHLLLLKMRAGTRQWKSVWAVLRAASLALYKNEDEYQPLYIIPFESIVDAVDVDNLSKSKRHCFMVITEERRLKFCASSEEEVAKWVGGFKALVSRRRENERGREGSAPAEGGPAATAGTSLASLPSGKVR